jgi:hypothetical protein
MRTASVFQVTSVSIFPVVNAAPADAKTRVALDRRIPAVASKIGALLPLHSAQFVQSNCMAPLPAVSATTTRGAWLSGACQPERWAVESGAGPVEGCWAAIGVPAANRVAAKPRALNRRVVMFASVQGSVCAVSGAQHGDGR